MLCQYCDKKVPLLRVLTGHQYCSQDHRCAHKEELNRLGLALLMGMKASEVRPRARSGGVTSPDSKDLENFSVQPLRAQRAGPSGALGTVTSAGTRSHSVEYGETES